MKTHITTMAWARKIIIGTLATYPIGQAQSIAKNTLMTTPDAAHGTLGAHAMKSGVYGMTTQTANGKSNGGIAKTGNNKKAPFWKGASFKSQRLEPKAHPYSQASP